MISAVRFFSKPCRELWAVAALFFFFMCFPPALASQSYKLERSVSKSKLIPEALIGFSLHDKPAHAIVVEKDTQTLMIYEYKDTFKLKHRFVCSTGEVRGRKERSGDRKTPEGVYFFTKAFKKRELSPIYGRRAFVMDYPNLMDQKSNRAGTNIWLHGTNKPIKPRDSNGCVAMKNDDLKILARYVRLNRTPIIIENRVNMVPPESQLANYESLIQFLRAWNTTFVSGDRKAYAACYDTPREDQNVLWEAWDKVRTTWQQDQVPFRMTMKDVSLMQTNPYVVALFDEVISLDRRVRFIGTEKLFLEKYGDTWKVVGEVYQPSGSHPDMTRPMVAALASLDRLYKEDKAIAKLVAEWAEAWRSKDIARYRACYANDFYGKGMNLKAWIRYKERLNRRYDWIRVKVEDLKISNGQKLSTATFLQRYSSGGLQSVGMKTLRLKRSGNAWKIYRETWHRTRK